MNTKLILIAILAFTLGFTIGSVVIPLPMVMAQTGANDNSPATKPAQISASIPQLAK